MTIRFGLSDDSRRRLMNAFPKEPVPPVTRIDLFLNMTYPTILYTI